MFDADHSLRLVTAGVVLLIGIGCTIAWLPATRRDPAGIPARLFGTIGVVMAIADWGGVGSVLGLSLAAMGVLVGWEGQPPPELPRPRRGGLAAAAVTAGVVTLATFDGWGPLARLPDQLLAVASLVLGATGALATLAIADRSRVTLRESIKRRFAPAPQLETPPAAL